MSFTLINFVEQLSATAVTQSPEGVRTQTLFPLAKSSCTTFPRH